MQFGSLQPLLTQLRGAELKLPPQVDDAVDLLVAKDSDQPWGQAFSPPTFDPLAADRSTLADTITIRARAVCAVIRDALGAQITGVLDEVATAVGECLSDHADDLLDQLRPRFDKAADAVHAASKLGIHAGITADDVIGLGTRAVTAWRGLLDHAATLDEVADIRTELANVLKIAPEPNPFGPRQYGAAFDTAEEWTTNHHRYGVHRWLRLGADRTNRCGCSPSPRRTGSSIAPA